MFPRLVRLFFLLLIMVSSFLPAQAAESERPLFTGFTGSSRFGNLFALRWKEGAGERRAWLRLGDQAGEYRLREFDAQTETLSVEDRSGRCYPLQLPEAKVRHEALSEQDYQKLLQFILEGVEASEVPVLSREKARAFYLENL